MERDLAHVVMILCGPRHDEHDGQKQTKPTPPTEAGSATFRATSA
jgi:hypothetical protein